VRYLPHTTGPPSVRPRAYREGAVIAAFWPDFKSNFVASLAASLLLILVAYLYVDNQLHLRARAEAAADGRRDKDERREVVLTAALEELEASAGTVGLWLQVLPKGHIPTPGLDATGTLSRTHPFSRR
jgi:hypothetical protein